MNSLPAPPVPPAPSPSTATRWGLVAIAFTLEAALVYIAVAAAAAMLSDGTPDNALIPYRLTFTRFVETLFDDDFAFSMLIAIPAFLAAQALFLWPVRKPAPPVAASGHSLWLTFAAAGLATALLWTGAIFIALDLLWLTTDIELLNDDYAAFIVVGTPLVCWLVATPVVASFCNRHRGLRESALGRLSARLLLGTLIEVVAVIPVDVMVRRKTDCYCGQGTFWALVACGTVGLFALGPAIFLPIIARRRKPLYAGLCDGCGYDMRATPNAARCPECGAGWSGSPLA